MAPRSSKGLVGGQGPPIEPVFEVAPDSFLDRAGIRLPFPVVDRHEELDDEDLRSRLVGHLAAPKITESRRVGMGITILFTTIRSAQAREPYWADQAKSSGESRRRNACNSQSGV